jgi:hypothetical protein
MKDWVKEKLDRIDELFPAERIAQSKRRWQCVWSGRLPDDRLPFTHWPRLFSYNEQFNDPADNEARLRANLDECIFHGGLRDDFIPSLFPGCKQNTIPSMFGAKQIVLDGNYFSERIIRQASDIDRLPEPTMGAGTVAHDWLSRQAYCVEETAGRIPVHVTDMQGPLDVCGQLWGYTDLFTCAYADPVRYHQLVSKVTDAFIRFWREQERVLGDRFVGTHLWPWSWVPLGSPATASADSLAMVSPKFFDEFMEPYYARIGQELNGIIIHSCGQFGHVLGSVQRIPCLKAINSSEMSLQSLLKAGLRKDLPLIMLVEYKNIFDVLKTVKELSLLVEIAVIMSPLVPTARTGDEPAMAINHPDEWTPQDWAVMHDRENRIIECAAMN